MPSIKVLIAEATEQLATSSDSSRLDAEVLLCFVLGKTRSYLRAWCDNEPTDEQCAKFLKLIQQRQQGIPVAYLTGMREFWSRDFIVTPDVLIPRPDTELLIELSLQLIPEHPQGYRYRPIENIYGKKPYHAKGYLGGMKGVQVYEPMQPYYKGNGNVRP